MIDSHNGIQPKSCHDEKNQLVSDAPIHKSDFGCTQSLVRLGMHPGTSRVEMHPVIVRLGMHPGTSQTWDAPSQALVGLGCTLTVTWMHIVRFSIDWIKGT